MSSLDSDTSLNSIMLIKMDQLSLAIDGNFRTIYIRNVRLPVKNIISSIPLHNLYKIRTFMTCLMFQFIVSVRITIFSILFPNFFFVLLTFLTFVFVYSS